MGAATRQRTVEDELELASQIPLVRDALRWVGHGQTRNRGTIGGSLVHADPSAELPLAAVVLNATLSLNSHADGMRDMAAQDFYLGPMFTATGDAECLVGIDWPVWPEPGVVTAFEEIAMRHGDFAMASAACQLAIDDNGICRRAAFGMGGVDGVPRAFPALAANLVGERIDARVAREIAYAATREIEPGSDLHADADYRRHLASVMLARALEGAVQRHPSSAASRAVSA